MLRLPFKHNQTTTMISTNTCSTRFVVAGKRKIDFYRVTCFSLNIIIIIPLILCSYAAYWCVYVYLCHRFNFRFRAFRFVLFSRNTNTDAAPLLEFIQDERASGLWDGQEFFLSCGLIFFSAAYRSRWPHMAAGTRNGITGDVAWESCVVLKRTRLGISVLAQEGLFVGGFLWLQVNERDSVNIFATLGIAEVAWMWVKREDKAIT